MHSSLIKKINPACWDIIWINKFVPYLTSYAFRSGCFNMVFELSWVKFHSTYIYRNCSRVRFWWKWIYPEVVREGVSSNLIIIFYLYAVLFYRGLTDNQTRVAYTVDVKYCRERNGLLLNGWDRKLRPNLASTSRDSTSQIFRGILKWYING